MDDNKSRVKEIPGSFTIKQALKFEWWFALIDSMSQSKTLTAMVIVACIAIYALVFFLFNM